MGRRRREARWAQGSCPSPHSRRALPMSSMSSPASDPQLRPREVLPLHHCPRAWHSGSGQEVTNKCFWVKEWMEQRMDDGEAWGPEQHGKGGGAHSTATNQRNQRGREGTVFVTLYVFNTCIYSSKMPTVEANPTFHKPCSDIYKSTLFSRCC